jgi:hypothetical protein
MEKHYHLQTGGQISGMSAVTHNKQSLHMAVWKTSRVSVAYKSTRHSAKAEHPNFSQHL